MYILDLLCCVTVADSIPAWMSFILNLFMHFLLKLYFFSFSINFCVSTNRFWCPLTLKKSKQKSAILSSFSDLPYFSTVLTHTHRHTHTHTPTLLTVLKVTFVKWSIGCWIMSYVSVTEQRKIEIMQFITHMSCRKYMAPPRVPHWEDKPGYRQRSADKT